LTDIAHTAQEAERFGFDLFHVGDHVGSEPSSLAALLAAALATTRLRICPLVLNNDLHHPVTLAPELATLDVLSEGRLEVGLGAGHSFPEYMAIGKQFDPPTVRKARLGESVEIVRRLLDGESVTLKGEYYHLHNASVLSPAQPRVPILIGVNGKQALAHAARHADSIGLTLLGRTARWAKP
jgi:probable F420-dependent oxidoreductase